MQVGQGECDLRGDTEDHFEMTYDLSRPHSTPAAQTTQTGTQPVLEDIQPTGSTSTGTGTGTGTEMDYRTGFIGGEEAGTLEFPPIGDGVPSGEDHVTAIGGSGEEVDPPNDVSGRDGDEMDNGDVTALGDDCVTDIPMDSSSIIPEAAMQCGILPMDAGGEEDSLNPMSSSGEGIAPASSSPPDPSSSSTAKQQQQQLCSGCKRPITERYLLKVMDQFWHEDCLKCSCCDCRLGEVGSTLFTKANLLLCRRDYLRLFGATGCCSVCSKMIPAFEMVMKAKGNVYHLECFACQQCNHRFCIGDRYYLYDNKILCEFDYEERIVFARLSHGYNALSNIKRQPQSISGLPANCP